jgi:hypothetical protein
MSVSKNVVDVRSDELQVTCVRWCDNPVIDIAVTSGYVYIPKVNLSKLSINPEEDLQNFIKAITVAHEIMMSKS